MSNINMNSCPRQGNRDVARFLELSIEQLPQGREQPFGRIRFFEKNFNLQGPEFLCPFVGAGPARKAAGGDDLGLRVSFPDRTAASSTRRRRRSTLSNFFWENQPCAQRKDRASTIFGVERRLRFTITVQEEVGIGHRLLDQLPEQKDFGRIDDGVDALLESLHRRKSLEGGAKQDDGGVPAACHRHCLQSLKRGVFFDRVRREKFLHDYNLVAKLAEADKKVAVCCRRMDLVTQFLQSALGCLQPFRSGKSQQRRLVCGADKIEFVCHGLFEFERGGKCGHRALARQNLLHPQGTDLRGCF